MKEEKKKIDYKNNFKEYFSIVNQNKFLFYSMILVVVIAEALAFADKFLYKIIIDDAEKFAAGNLIKSDFVNILLIVGAVFLGIIILRSIFKYLSFFLIAKFEPLTQKHIKEKYFNHILKLHHGFHTTHKTGSLISKLGRGQSAIEGLTDVLVFQMGPLIVQFIVVITSMAVFQKAAAISLFVTASLFMIYSIYINNKQVKMKVKMNNANDNERGFISDVFTNVESIKYYGKENNINKRARAFFEKSRFFTSKYWNTYSQMEFGHALILGLGTVATLYFPLNAYLNNEITLGTVVFIYTIYAMISGTLFRFVWGIKNFSRSMADLNDLFEYGKVKNEIKDKKNAKGIKITKGEIEFKDVSFRYPEKNNKGKKVFENFNLKIKPNETVAFVGHSGSGKTTIVKLFNRLYDVDHGSISIDDKNIKDVKQESLRSESGIVPQEAILFDDTIYNNLKFANPSANKNDILKAVKLSQLDEIIKTLPKGLNTIVGERGVKLSGGEKQRVSIARAILANKKILVLDEATSALDSRTENKIQKALDNLLKNRTSIVIAHRLSTIMKADRIVVLDKGRIVEQGSHKELLKNKGEYYKLWNMQSGGYIQE